ncbi:ABC transporter transmembrane domain-containing protein, partial [Bacteriovoracaceae bacterium]|nr:ABC transporter transmembrane domain-containing protein [Bacteriovoracaceae bacterium]
MKKEPELKYFFNLCVKTLKPEASFYLTSVVYGIGVSILSLAIPISVQALVNTVSFGVLTQPIIILSFILLGLLILSGVLNAFQVYVIELFQRHFYTRVSTDITLKLLYSTPKELSKKNGVDLVNRYFDVMTVQKKIAILLTGGITIVLQTIVGLLLLAFYHPYFLIFDIIFIIMLWPVWSIYSKKAIIAATEESKSKYEMATWLEEIARINHFFKNTETKSFAIQRADQNIKSYLINRKKHFYYLFSQNVLLLIIYAVMSSFILGLGGLLVIKEELTVGQLVAAELIVTVILGSFSKFGKYLESIYDLIAATEKISSLYAIDQYKEPESIIDEVKKYDLKLSKI